MSDLKLLNAWLEFIGNPDNYYAGFPYVIEYSDMARREIMVLFDDGQLSDSEYHAYLQRLDAARKQAIEKHLDWTIKTLSKNDKHTVETVVRSVYSDIFRDIK